MDLIHHTGREFLNEDESPIVFRKVFTWLFCQLVLSMERSNSQKRCISDLHLLQQLEDILVDQSV